MAVNGLSRSERQLLVRLKIKQAALLREQAHRIARRASLLSRRAPAEWLNRYTEEIADTNEELRQIEIDVNYLLQVQYSGR